MDSALEQVASLNVPQVPADVEGLRDDVTKFRRSAGQHLGNFEKEVATAKQTLDQQVKEAQQSVRQTTTQIESKLAEVESEKKALETAKQQFQSQFSEAQDRRSKQFNEAVNERTKQFQELVGDAQSKLDAGLDALIEKGDEYIEQLKKQRDDARRVSDEIGADALSGGFQSAANVEKTAADRWRWVGVIVFSLAIAGQHCYSAPSTKQPSSRSLARRLWLSSPCSVSAPTHSRSPADTAAFSGGTVAWRSNWPASIRTSRCSMTPSATP